MMNGQSVEQILLVLRLFRERYAKGEPLRKSYQEAVREVSDRYSVKYQTIGDAFRRRLQLKSIDQLYALLDQWTKGDPDPLMNQLKASSDRSTHNDITRFFENAVSSSQVRYFAESSSEDKVETFSINLREPDARKLRALAELEGVRPSEILNELVGPAVTERIKSRLK